MKLNIFAFLGIVIFMHPDCFAIDGSQAETRTNVTFNVYDRYSYKGPHPQFDTNVTFFYCTTGQEAFDSLFFYIFDHNGNDTIPSADILNKKMISIVKYGNSQYDLKINHVNLFGETLDVEYISTLVAKNMTWTAAIPLIIAVNGSFQEVKFFENGAFIHYIKK